MGVSAQRRQTLGGPRREGGREDGAGSTHRLSTACMEMYRAGTLKVSKNTSAAFSRFLLGLSGASVRRTGCCKRWQLWACAGSLGPGGLCQEPPSGQHRGRSALPFLHQGTSLLSAGTYSCKEPALWKVPLSCP